MPSLPTRSRAPLVLVGSPGRREISDAELAKSLIAGEEWAVTETWYRFAPMVLTMAERALGSKPEADDLAQEVFARLFRRAHTLQDPNCLRSFVYSFAVFGLKSELRRRKLRGWLWTFASEALLELGHRSVDVESRDLLRRFYGLLDRLSPRDRLVFSLKELESMTIEEVAEVMTLSISTVKRSLAHANDRLSHWIRSDPGLAEAFDTKRWQR